MAAVYHNMDSTPYTMFVLEVDDATEEAFRKAMNEQLYPFPTSDVVILDGDTIVDQFDLKRD